MIKTITLDTLCDPRGDARKIFLKWNYAPMSGFILNNQDVVERAWFHYKSKTRTARPASGAVSDIPGTVIITYDDSVRQLKGSTPKTIISALQYWWSTGETW
jgi:hypothetical protein